jgi:NADPH:quinone reductase
MSSTRSARRSRASASATVSGSRSPATAVHRALTVAEDGPARLRPTALEGRTVLVAGGAGAVGNAAIQLARWAGAETNATVSSDAKARLARDAGAHHVVHYRDGDAGGQIRGIAPDGVDLVVEVAAGANAALDLSVLRPRGTISGKVLITVGDEHR